MIDSGRIADNFDRLRDSMQFSTDKFDGELRGWNRNVREKVSRSSFNEAFHETNVDSNKARQNKQQKGSERNTTNEQVL